MLFLPLLPHHPFLHLPLSGFEPVVLEARDRVGGRVSTRRDTGVSVGIDLGASIITGIDADPRTVTNLGKGVPADPSAVIARQLGLKLVILGEEMSLYDATTARGSPCATRPRSLAQLLLRLPARS